MSFFFLQSMGFSLNKNSVSCCLKTGSVLCVLQGFHEGFPSLHNHRFSWLCQQVGWFSRKALPPWGDFSLCCKGDEKKVPEENLIRPPLQTGETCRKRPETRSEPTSSAVVTIKCFNHYTTGCPSSTKFSKLREHDFHNCINKCFVVCINIVFHFCVNMGFTLA